MENRERDRVSQRTTPTEAGEINRKTSEEKGRENSGSGAEFGQSIGRSEHLSEGEGGTMRNRNDDMNSNVGNKNMDNEQSRRPTGESGYGSSSGRSGSGSLGNSGSNKGSSSGSSNISGGRGSGSSGGGSMGDSSEGRH